MSRKKNNNRKPRQFTTVQGKVQMGREGSGFIVVEGEPDNDVFVKAGKMRGALNGDLVKVGITRPKTDRSHREGEVLDIIERSKRPFVGYLHVLGDQAWVLMQSKNMPYDIEIPYGKDVEGAVKTYSPDGTFSIHDVVDEEGVELKAKSGMKVAAVVDFWKKSSPTPSGHIVDVLGEPGANDTEMHAILAAYDLPYRFEPEVASAADSISEKITDKDLEGRRDYRGTLTFTIDPTDAKDFDDALSFHPLENGNYEVGVHIADVSYYVTPGSIVDKEARERGTSVYLVDRTVPMLPEKLCNKLCSLRPKEDKLCFSAVFEITPLGKVISRWLGRTVINSDYRFDYDEAQSVIMGDPSRKDLSPEVIEAITVLNNLALKFRKKRFAAGAINFERPEMKVLVDENGKPIEIHQKISFEANWLIEEFMLLANRSVAEFCSKTKKTFVYRVHDEPDSLKLERLGQFVRHFGFKLGSIENGKAISKSLGQLFTDAKDCEALGAIENLSLRAMAKAVYTTDNIGHYGLAFPYYTHFTSPIRRYPDLMVHRLLASYLNEEKSADKLLFEEECKHASEREGIAAEAERTSVKYKLVEYMEDKIGLEFDGHISGLTGWGMYVEIEPTKIEGMVALREIPGDFFEFDEDNMRIVGRRTHKSYRFGDAVRIRVKKANLEQITLDFELVLPEGETVIPAPAPARDREKRVPRSRSQKSPVSRKRHK
ncbi:MAG: ribonuclease R [Bacteroidales bacterium]|nr:ribonuclease R [Bacteroidales bacterium]